MTIDSFMKDFGDNLDIVLHDYGMTQKELADELGISKSAISQYINGSRMPSLDIFVNIVRILSCEYDDLIDTNEIIK